jgi:glyoxylase-like metal-dependent hydrolase (beta-lactamase superfamily II)
LVDETRALRRVFPTITYSQEMRIADGGRDIRLISLTGDQEGTTIAWLPKERVLLSGDAVAYPLPYVSGHPSQQVAALNQLAALDPLVIIPGHGPALRDLAYLRLEQALIRTAIDQVRILWDAGVRGRDEIRRRVSAEALREAFAHSDPDLEQRFTARVADLAGLAFDELKESGGGPA